MSTLTYHYKEKDLRRGPLIENPSKHRLHNAATVKEYLFQPITIGTLSKTNCQLLIQEI